MKSVENVESDDRIVLDAAAAAGIEHLLFREITRLSGGEAQRVLLATVLVQDPPILLLDEPSSAQDPRQTTRMFSLLRRLAESGKTVVAAVHDVNLAAAFADAFFAMKEGEIVFDAPIEELNEDILERVYDASFEPYTPERGEKREKTRGGRVWHARIG
jgi:iron complex transport system ATP-binding protein